SFQMTKMGAQLALDKITEAVNSGEVYVEEREKKWLDIIGNQIDDIADDELEFYDDMQDELDMDKFIPSEYGL
ncbi:MAG: methyltransferase MtaB domain-containing protein, partial [Intestinibacter bartlettii]|nr:methyltransferase MtaB domain-containing protein [Intestinibacter bartlettii]